jgi:hypothetical protein
MFIVVFTILLLLLLIRYWALVLGCAAVFGACYLLHLFACWLVAYWYIALAVLYIYTIGYFTVYHLINIRRFAWRGHLLFLTLPFSLPFFIKYHRNKNKINPA